MHGSIPSVFFGTAAQRLSCFFFVTTFQRFPLADVLLRPKTVTGVDYLKGDWRNGVVSHPKDGSKNYRVWVPVRCSRVFFYAYMYTIHIIPFFM